MTDSPTTGPSVAPRVPLLGRIEWADIGAALRLGLRDFLRAPAYGLFFGGVFAAAGIGIVLLLGYFNAPWMILPIAIGFPLVGPFAAAGLYEVSRRLAAGLPLSWRAVLLTVFRQRERQLGWMAFVVLFIFWVWVYQVRLLIALFMGFGASSSLERFMSLVLTTQNGLTFLVIGSLVGLVLALVLFSATVIAMPLLLDREVDFVTAVITSFRTVVENPLPMLGWGVVITVLTLTAMLPAFLGLLVVMPVLGHATWHLYANAVKAAAPAA